MNEIKVLIADDDNLTRRGLRAFIKSMPGWVVCGEAATGRETVELTAKLQPHVIVMDMTMPELNGLDATRQIKNEYPAPEVLMFTAVEAKEVIQQVFGAGARNYILKTGDPMEFESALRMAAAHKSYFTNEVGEILFSKMLVKKKGSVTESSEEQLTNRQRQIVQLLAEGNSNKVVAEKTSTTIATVETQRAAIMKMLHFEAFSEMVRHAVRNNLVLAKRPKSRFAH